MVIECRLVGDPKPTIVWYVPLISESPLSRRRFERIFTSGCSRVRRLHNNTVLKSSAKYLLAVDNDQKLYYLARLEIRNVKSSDKGEYQIVAKNILGEAQTHTVLSLREENGHPK